MQFCLTEYTDRSTGTKLKQRHRLIRLQHPAKSAVEDQIISLSHCIQPHNATILFTKPRYTDRLIREANETDNELHHNREDGFCLSKSCKPLTCSLKVCRNPRSQDSPVGFSMGHGGVCTVPLPGHKPCPLRAPISPKPSSAVPGLPTTPLPHNACLKPTHSTSLPPSSVLGPPYTHLRLRSPCSHICTKAHFRDITYSSLVPYWFILVL